ncbi:MULTISPECIES: Gx transporter family protein [Pseudothermotoga]|uniref:Heptaprenyl diphosphate synthase component I n=1 Tax=Pseudothermotoga lettingae (strain ATCC BAA-301 / DSM 14385 / NBRC 107922 / TMO) TaxID=416591 RepID=A8F4C2_PSELT|nr:MULTISPECIES: Gx transporter family protein [Pseudothermotoga]ABV33006.1 Heptaprenyl diphosphate synthase component I [Pseudothermotoga lettingae TMO]KUK21021.1 MAG: Heptaprenyl diphosphate synthase component I [Pseudothermotoga lettingae]
MRAKRIALTALMISLGVVTYVLESVVPFPIPNGKWGFSNFVVLLSIFAFGGVEGIKVAIGKSLIGSILTGHFMDVAFFMSVAGSSSAALIETVLSRVGFFGLFGVSLCGSIANNIAQIFVGSVFLQSKSFFIILPYMLFLGIPGALANAYIVKRVLPYVERIQVSTGFDFTTKENAAQETVPQIRNNRSGN